MAGRRGARPRCFVSAHPHSANMKSRKRLDNDANFRTALYERDPRSSALSGHSRIKQIPPKRPTPQKITGLPALHHRERRATLSPRIKALRSPASGHRMMSDNGKGPDIGRIAMHDRHHRYWRRTSGLSSRPPSARPTWARVRMLVTSCGVLAVGKPTTGNQSPVRTRARVARPNPRKPSDS